MALGRILFGMLPSTAVVRIEKASASVSGGTVLTWSTVTGCSAVDVLMTTTAGGRDFPSGTFNDRDSCKVAGEQPELNRPDVRLYVSQTVPGLKAFEGRYLSVTGGTGHAEYGGILAARISLTCSVLQVPGDAATEL
jgi:hypothetical protein